MKYFKLFAFLAFAVAMALLFTNCSEGKEGPEQEKEYVSSNMKFNFEYSGNFYELIDLDFEIYINNVKAKNVKESKSDGNINFEVGGIPSLSRINVYLTRTRNSAAIDTSKKYNSSTLPSFTVTRCFNDGTTEDGGTVTVNADSFSNYDSNQVEEYINNYNVSTYSIDLDSTGAIM